MLVKKYLLFFSLPALLFFGSCEKKGPDPSEQIPNVPVNLIINLDLPSYYHLNLAGSFLYMDGGHKGVLIFHGYDDQFYAFDRSCSYQPYNACSMLWVDSSNHQAAFCGTYTAGVFEKCCDSRFELPTGFPNQAPAQYPMKQYAVHRSGNMLSVTN